MLGKAKLIGYGVALLLSAGALTWVYSHIYDKGAAACEAKHAAALEEARNESRQLADALEQAKKESRQAAEAKTRVIYREADPTGCADSPALGSVLEAHGYPTP